MIFDTWICEFLLLSIFTRFRRHSFVCRHSSQQHKNNTTNCHHLSIDCCRYSFTHTYPPTIQSHSTFTIHEIDCAPINRSIWSTESGAVPTDLNTRTLSMTMTATTTGHTRPSALSSKGSSPNILVVLAALVVGWCTLMTTNSIFFVDAKAILGIDLGSLYMKVALVQRGAPLEIVTNLHSKRKTEQMILFDQGTRFYGADASSLLARKPTQTTLLMSIMLGRDEDHPAVKVS